MRTEDHVHLRLVPGLEEIVGAPYSVAMLPTAECTAVTFTSMHLGDFFGRMGGVVDHMVGSADSINHRRIRVDRNSILDALDSPVDVICSHWPAARQQCNRLDEYTIALRASLLERIGLLSLPAARPAVSTPMVSVGGAFGDIRGSATEVLVDAFARRDVTYARWVDLTRMRQSIHSMMSQWVPADLLVGYWGRYREHFLVAHIADHSLRNFVITGGLDGLIFGPGRHMERYLREPVISVTGRGTVDAGILSNGSISTPQVSYADVLSAVFAQRTDDSVMAGAPVQPPPDKKYTAKHAKLSVLLRPTRTVFGIPVQVESDGSEIFVKPRTEGGK